MFDLSRWETWVVLITLVVSLLLATFVFKHDRQDLSILEKVTDEENVMIVFVIASSIEEAEKLLRTEYSEMDWEIMDKYFDIQTRKAIFKLRRS